MSDYIFKLPDIGEGVAQAEIIAWHVEAGDMVEEDQPLVDVMTDKATVQIGCPVAGRVVSRKGEVGSMAAIGDELVDDEIENIKVTGLRRQIAERMLESKRNIPHFSYCEEVDVTALEALRADLNGARDVRPKLTILALVIRAMVRALAAHPAINAHFDGEAHVIRRVRAVHAGVATQTPRGLVVPVIRDAETLDVWSIAAEILRLSTAARAGKATRAELSGSTITVSSLGALGGIFATPIIKPPEVAIIGVNKVVVRPVFRQGAVAAARLMNLSSSFDHRVVDGFEAAAFIRSLKEELEAPARLFFGG